MEKVLQKNNAKISNETASVIQQEATNSKLNPE